MRLDIIAEIAFGDDPSLRFPGSDEQDEHRRVQTGPDISIGQGGNLANDDYPKVTAGEKAPPHMRDGA
jgi:hypothetical protein